MPETTAQDPVEEMRRRVLGGRSPADAYTAALRDNPRSPLYQPRRKNDNPEGRVNAAVKEWLTLHKVFHYRQNNLPTPLPGGRGYRPVDRKGLPDFVAVISGRHVGIECKSDVGRQSDDQKDFERDLNAAGGLYLLVRSVDDLERHVKPLIHK